MDALPGEGCCAMAALSAAPDIHCSRIEQGLPERAAMVWLRSQRKNGTLQAKASLARR
jgi:hypothetical protein